MSEAASAGQPVIIVSGLPRSGTSMMMQMLEAGGIPPLTDRVRGADEDNPRGYYEFERVKALPADTAWLPEARGKVVKMVYRLLYGLPGGYQYRVVFMQRNLQEVVRSQDEMLRRHGHGTEQTQPDQMVDLYRRQLQDVEAWLQRQPNFQVLYVDFQEVMNQPGPVAERLNDFLGGNLQVEAMRRVPDAALYRQRA